MNKPLDFGPLTLENLDQQFCSTWLKDEMRRVFQERDKAERAVEIIEYILVDPKYGYQLDWVKANIHGVIRDIREGVL